MQGVQAMIVIDGSLGEGGGQIVRSSLALSMVTGKPVTIEKLRARRNKPGLQRQHLTAVNAAQCVCEARVYGAKLNSQHLEFRPQRVRSGDFKFDIGTAGSTTLVLQTVLPVLMLADAPSTVTLIGGTHNPLAPPFEYFMVEYLPLLRRMGADIDARLVQHGFYPAGGGEIAATIKPPAALASLELLQRGELRARRVSATSARLPHDVAQREVDTVRERTDWPDLQSQCHQQVRAKSPGNYVTLELEFERIAVLFTQLGQRGVRAERVAELLVQQANDYLASDAPVGSHLADQILLPMSLAAQQGRGGRFRTGELTEHSRTHIDVLQRFLDVRIEVKCRNDGTNLVSVSPA
jgi:RNA 3'-terminal phosphate cyclase (ATP)